MKVEKRHITAIGLGIFIIIVDFLFLIESVWFIPMIIIAISLAWGQFWLDFFIKRQRRKDLESRFPDFVRNLVGTIDSGMPVSKAIIYVSKTDYGSLTPYVKKLANQVEWAIPIHKALMTFGNNTNSDVIRRAISTVIEAEESGGNIEDVLETVTESVIKIKRIKQVRKASIHSQVIQSYIIFAVFLTVMVVIQNLVVPYVSDLGGRTFVGGVSEPVMSTQTGVGTLIDQIKIDYSSIGGFLFSFGEWLTSLRGVFLVLSLIQGLFAGIVIGKLSEGDVYAGLKHSLILMTFAFFVISLAQAF